MRGRFALLTLVALGLTACNAGDFPGKKETSTVPPVTGYALYHAYGDSITAGVGVASPSLVYAALAADYNSVNLSDYAIGGDESCDVPTRQIFANSDSPTLATPGLYSLLIGTNDVDVRGTGAGELTYNLCDQAAISWLATPLEMKLLATSSQVTVTGASHLETLDNFNALTTDALGATITFPFTRTAVAPLYLWYRITDNTSFTFTCALDGSTVTTLAGFTSPAILTPNSTTTSVGVYRLASVPVGTHSLQCTQDDAGSSGMGLIAIAGPPPAGTLQRPRLLVGLLPLQLNGSRSSLLAVYDADIRGNVAIFAGDGLDVELFDAAAYMTGTSADMSDLLHPNAVGHQEIFKAFQLSLN